MSIYLEFKYALVDHYRENSGNTAARLAAVRGRVKNDPNYDERLHNQTVFAAEQIAHGR